jgi:FlaA1/EpsC-like NDP-sugar epimerase
MKRVLKSLNFYIIFGLDVALVLAAHYLAYMTRFEGVIPDEHFTRMSGLLPIIALIKPALWYFFNLYRGMWRYTSLPDVYNVLKASTAATLFLVLFLALTQNFSGYSRSVFLLDWLYTCLFAAGLRISIRSFYGLGLIRLPAFIPVPACKKLGDADTRKVVLLGGGRLGEKMIREILEHPDSGIRITAVFDDEPIRRGLTIHGIPIVGPIKAMPGMVKSGEIKASEALIAVNDVSGEAMRSIVDSCLEAGLSYKKVPGLHDIAEGKVSVKDLRDVDYKDLLGREPVDLDTENIASFLTGKTVLVTGAGGSIGSELCRQVLPFKPKKLLLLDSSEYNLYNIQMELEHQLGFKDYFPVLGTLRDREWLNRLLDEHKPEVIFHAAAYKHVPMLEHHPWQAVWNNVQATYELVNAAVSRGVERLLIVSTDKAVRPTNVMGASKRLTEKIMLAHCGHGTRMMAVRFGNVLGSAGSVIPLFRKQIAAGGPVTVTHPEVTRYFMTVDEACRLILQACSMGVGGEIFVLKMGRPVVIAQMAEDLIRLSGKEPGVDIEVKFIGMRPGEKLYEELITEDEGVVPTEHSQIMVLSGTACGKDDIQDALVELKDAADDQDGSAVREALKQAVPEYTPQG